MSSGGGAVEEERRQEGNFRIFFGLFRGCVLVFVLSVRWKV